MAAGSVGLMMRSQALRKHAAVADQFSYANQPYVDFQWAWSELALRAFKQAVAKENVQSQEVQQRRSDAATVCVC